MTIFSSLGGWPGVLGWVAAIVAPVLVWLASRRKSDIDESAMILGKWKELVQAHEAAILRLTEEFARERTRWNEEGGGMRRRIGELENEGRAKDIKIKMLEDEVSGLKRAIAQNSQSAAFQLGRHSRRNSSPEDKE